MHSERLRARGGAHGRRLAIALATLHLVAAPAVASEDVYQAQDGLLVVEFESVTPGGSWSEESDIAGHTGTSYIRWDGPDHFHQPGNGLFGVEFDVFEGGWHALKLRNRHDHPDSTEANDVWVRMDGGEWLKVYSWMGGTWNWKSTFELADGTHTAASYNLPVGRHRIEFSGRSHDFVLDRLHLGLAGHPDLENAAVPESPTLGVGNRRPLARIRVTPEAIPAEGTTVVTLDGRESLELDEGQQLSFRWSVRGEFVQGTGPTSPVARVAVQGGLAMPVRLVVTDDAEEPASSEAFEVIDVEENAARFSGPSAVWHPLTVDFAGPSFSETDTAPNPFLDRRLEVTFTGPAGQTYRVPGFFAGDGEGGDAGNVWRARFSPDQAGRWRYSASFRRGAKVAIDLDPLAGVPDEFDGDSGEFGVLPRDPSAEGFLALGRLDYVGEHYFKHVDGPWFLKGGTDSPENFFGYRGFDGAQDAGGIGILHDYAAHVIDWEHGDPYFVSDTTGVDSRGIVGALNYLSEQEVNSIYFLPMNLGGDGQDTFPFVGPENTYFAKTHYDLGRMHQWGQVFDHATRKGILLHFVLAETEAANEGWLDGGELGVERKLFYRELIARFGHVLGLKWNLSEENDFPVQQLVQFAGYIDALDAYDHPISVHTHPNNFEDYWALAGNPLFSATSIQFGEDLANEHVELWRQQSAQSGHRWVIDMDENNPWHTGLTDSNADELRKKILYDVYFSGGQVEWYMGYHDLPLGGDLRCENFRTREAMWRYMASARRMMAEYLPFHEMQPMDERAVGESMAFGGAQVFGKAGEAYAVYYPEATATGTLDLSDAGSATRAAWWNPRSGQLEGGWFDLVASPSTPVGAPPSSPGEDWVLLVLRP